MGLGDLHIPTVYYRRSTVVLMTSSNGNIFRVSGTLCEEFTSHRWIPLTKTSELWCFLWSASEQTAEWTIEMPVIWDAIALTITSLWWWTGVWFGFPVPNINCLRLDSRESYEDVYLSVLCCIRPCVNGLYISVPESLTTRSLTSVHSITLTS